MRIFALLLALFLIPSVNAAGIDLELIVGATLGVDLIVEDNPIILTVGETGGTTLTIVNEGNIRDKIRVTGRVFVNGQATDWVHIAFICEETVGECDDIPSSELHTIDNVDLTPETYLTNAFLEITSWRKYNTGDNLDIQLFAQSLSDKTSGAGPFDVEIIVNAPGDERGPLSSPGLSNLSILILFFLVSVIAIVRKDVI